MILEAFQRGAELPRRASAGGLLRFLPLVAIVLLGSAKVEESNAVTISSRSVRVKDVARYCSPSVCEVLVGRAPPPGSSTLYTVARVRNRVLEAGLEPKEFRMPQSVRVHSAAVRLTMKQWGDAAKSHLLTDLPPGVELLTAEGKLPLVLPVGYRLGAITYPRMPRRSGAWRTTATVEILHEGAFLRKAPVVVRLQLSDEAIRPHIRRGQGLTLIVERKAASISMQGVAMKDAELGSVLPCRVTKTGRVVRARLRSATVAEVVETP